MLYEVITSAMLIETFVLSGDDRLLHIGRDLVDGDEGAAFFPEFADQRAVSREYAQRQFGFVVRQRLERRQVGVDQGRRQAGQSRADDAEADD